LKTFIDPQTSEVFAYEADGSQDDFIKAGLTPISEEELAALRAPTLDELRQAKISEIVAACQAEMDAGFTSSFAIKMDSNLAALQKIKLGYDFAVIMGATEMEIVDYNNAAHTMPIADVLMQMLETGGHYLTLYTKKQVLRAQAMAAVSVAELDAVVW
jgi:hypothetical protein